MNRLFSTPIRHLILAFSAVAILTAHQSNAFPHDQPKEEFDPKFALTTKAQFSTILRYSSGITIGATGIPLTANGLFLASVGVSLIREKDGTNKAAGYFALGKGIAQTAGGVLLMIAGRRLTRF